MIALGLALLLALSLTALPATAAGNWYDAYRDFVLKEQYLDANDEAEYDTQVIEEYGNYNDHYLRDLNRDGIPELIILQPGVTIGSSVCNLYTFQNGKITWLGAWNGYLHEQDASGNYSGVFIGLHHFYGDIVYVSIENGVMKDEWVVTYEDGLDVVKTSNRDLYQTWLKIEAAEEYASEPEETTKESLAGIKASGWDAYVKSQGFSQPSGQQPAGKTASPTSHSMTVDGKPVTPAAYNIDGNNYFKLRDIAALLNGSGAQFQVAYNQQTRAISLTTGQSYTAVGGELTALPSGAQKIIPTPSAVYVDGKQVSFTAYNINGNNYFKLRDLGQALGFQVGWNEDTRTILVETR